MGRREMIVRFPGEEEAIREVCAAGRKYGYGNLISELQKAWAEQLRDGGVGMRGALMAAGIVCVYCGADRRTGEKYKGGE